MENILSKSRHSLVFDLIYNDFRPLVGDISYANIEKEIFKYFMKRLDRYIKGANQFYNEYKYISDIPLKSFGLFNKWDRLSYEEQNEYIRFANKEGVPDAPEAPSAICKYLTYLDNEKKKENKYWENEFEKYRSKRKIKNIDWENEFNEYRPRRLERLKKSYSGKKVLYSKSYRRINK